jgi:hypothetical protein
VNYDFGGWDLSSVVRKPDNKSRTLPEDAFGTKPAANPRKAYESYEAERLDLVVQEIAREFGQPSPNWVYLDSLEAERKYWQERAKAAKRARFDGGGFFKTFWDFGNLGE